MLPDKRKRLFNVSISCTLPRPRVRLVPPKAKLREKPKNIGLTRRDSNPGRMISSPSSYRLSHPLRLKILANCL
jgi:hypothetical protein